MSEPTSTQTDRFGAFVAERFPAALAPAREAFAVAVAKAATGDDLRTLLRSELHSRLAVRVPELPETTPGVSAETRLAQATLEIVEACDGFLRREELAASLTAAEKREVLTGMLLTRATDNRLKTFFLGGEVRYKGSSFQGKGFRSLGQEAIYAAALRLRRGTDFVRPDGTWGGDVVAPLIRDAGVAIAMNPDGDVVRRILSAQMAKAGPPMNGKDLHLGDWEHGIFPASAPLAISALTIAGVAFAFAQEGEGRVAVAFNGEGSTSLGEWHEAINLCAARKLPAVFCVEQNGTALSTPLADQTAVRTFADKAVGYGIPGITLDGTDPEAIAAAFAWAVERARAGLGPTLLELVSLRMCGHAHHDDMLYLGREPQVGWEYPEWKEGGYADPERYRYWSERDPIRRWAARLEAEGLLTSEEFEKLKRTIEDKVERQACAVIEAPWPEPAEAGEGVYGDGPPARHVEVLENRPGRVLPLPGLPELEPGAPPDPKGNTFLDAIMMGVGDALRADPRVFVYGEDVGGQYGNAFLLLRPLLAEFGGRILNSPIAESGVLGVAIGAALSGLRPIAEMQFNDFVATGFNQLVNNAAKIRYRWGGGVPMVVRMPWGGLRKAGPYHSQNTEGWFYRTPGLKIVVPSTPEDARALLAAAVLDPDPVLYYEHIALYRDPRIKQKLAPEPPAPLPLGKAALRRAGSDLAIVSYGAYVHVATRVAEKLAAHGIACAVLDLRCLCPLDRDALLGVARHCGKVLVVHEDTRTGGIGESLAAIIQEEAFEYLDAPVRILGALDTPVPYSPPLEEEFLVSEEQVERAARLLAAY
ncbi:MAG: thiamine pyrophosphate-dependent enzyme [Thermoanaerobaculia bacterium]|nr:thiamine pyrophosphate-dependent enzyme [Thermoanaerobaculia bacterium]